MGLLQLYQLDLLPPGAPPLDSRNSVGPNPRWQPLLLWGEKVGRKGVRVGGPFFGGTVC